MHSSRAQQTAARSPRAGTLPTPQQLKHSRLYSEELNIDLADRTDTELFKWFLAAVLYGARISETIAAQTYRSFERHRLLDPESILAAGWDFLVNPVMHLRAP